MPFSAATLPGFLAPHGISATHWMDIGRIGDPDEVIFDYARKHEAILVTQDLDFPRILALSGSRVALRIPD